MEKKFSASDIIGGGSRYKTIKQKYHIDGKVVKIRVKCPKCDGAEFFKDLNDEERKQLSVLRGIEVTCPHCGHIFEARE